MKHLILALATLLAAPLAAPAALAHEFTAGALVIHHPYAFETAPMALAAGGYFSVENKGDAADRLVAVEAPPYRAEIHESVEQNGMHKMLPVEALDIPAHDTAVLAPGGYHVMFLELNGAAFAEGDRVPATLVFEKAGRVEVVFNVQKRKDGDAMPGMDHGKADHAAPSN